MKSNYEGNVTVILYDRNAKPREIPWDNNDGRGEVMYYPVVNDDGFHLLVDIPMLLMKKLCGAHPDRYRLFKYERAIPATRSTPSGANETVWICPWKYRIKSRRKDPTDPDSELLFSYEFTEHRFGVPEGAKILESKPVQPQPRPPVPKPIQPPRPPVEEPNVVDVGVSKASAVEIMPEPEDIKKSAPVDGEVKTRTEYAKPPKGEFPPIRSEKEILAELKNKCMEVGVDYTAANTEFREKIDRKSGAFGVKYIGDFEKFIEGKLKETG